MGLRPYVRQGRGLWRATTPVIALLALAAAGCAGSAPRATGGPASSAGVAAPGDPTVKPAAVPAPPPRNVPAPVAASTAAAAGRLPATDWRDAVLYFAIVDRFADGDRDNDGDVDLTSKSTFHGGDLKGLTQNLDEIASLGVTALWITPVVKNIPGFVSGAGFPDWGYHGYWADDFNKLDPRFGTEEDLKALVEAAHRRGIRVLLDVVYNHAGYNTQYLRNSRTRRWLRNDEDRTCGNDDLTSCLLGLPDWKTELPDVRDFLFKAHLGLAKRVALDGFRLDTVKHVTHEFWQEHRSRVRTELGPDFFLLGEVWGGDAQSLDPWFSGDELDAGFDFGFQGSTLGWIKGRGRTVAFDRYLQSREKVRGGHELAQFLSSHDVPGALFQLDGNKALFRLAVILQMTTAGIPTVYYGEEVGRIGGDWPDNRSDMPWGTRDVLPGHGQPRDEALREDYRKLIAIRRSHPAIARGTHVSLASDGDVLVFGRRDAADGQTVVVAVNRGTAAGQATFALPTEWSGVEALQDLWTGDRLPVANGQARFEVAARGARILVPAGPDGH